MKNYDKELAFAKKLALEAGEIILKNFSSSTYTIKANSTPVTETDIAISHLVTAAVKKTFPTYALMDEELDSKIKDAKHVWVCDPIDGTVPFSHSIPTSMFSLALCEDGEPVVAVIYDPYMKRLLYTQKGSAAFMNGQKIQVSNKKLAAGDAIYTIPNWLKDLNYDRFFAYFKAKKVIVTAVESVVYLSMLVASGVIPGAIMGAANPWDRAAAKLIIENAGGLCTDVDKPLTVFGKHRYFIASNRVVHEELVQLINKCLMKRSERVNL